MIAKLVVDPAAVPHFSFHDGLLRFKQRVWIGNNPELKTRILATVTEPPNYTRLSRKIIQRKDNSINLSPYNPVVREISTDFKPFHITAKIVLSSAVTIISYIKVRGIKYIGI
jgi:hypothetical protein